MSTKRLWSATIAAFVMTSWEYVMKLANREELVFNNLKYAKIELNDLNEKIVEAKKKLINAQAQLRRMNNKLS